jgi:hypothetical protein
LSCLVAERVETIPVFVWVGKVIIILFLMISEFQFLVFAVLFWNLLFLLSNFIWVHWFFCWIWSWPWMGSCRNSRSLWPSWSVWMRSSRTCLFTAVRSNSSINNLIVSLSAPLVEGRLLFGSEMAVRHSYFNSRRVAFFIVILSFIELSCTFKINFIFYVDIVEFARPLVRNLSSISTTSSGWLASSFTTRSSFMRTPSCWGLPRSAQRFTSNLSPSLHWSSI